MNLTTRMESLLPLVRQASELALSRFGRVQGRTKPDRTLVSAVDEEVEALLVQGLRQRFPGETIVGEETGATGELEGPVWAVDPIDGTSAYLSRLPYWGVSVGLLVEGRPVLGLVDLPVLGETYRATAGGGAWLETGRWGRERLQVQSCIDPDREAMLCAPSNSNRAYQMDFPGKVRSLGCTVAHVLLVARGDAVGALMRVHLWDLAGCGAILAEAGGRMETLEGGPVNLLELLPGRESVPSVLAAAPSWLPELRRRVRVRAQGS